MDITRALNSIGKKCFVENFELFKNCTDKNALASALLRDNPNACSLSAQLTRVNYAKMIFDNHLERKALEIIIASKKLASPIQNKAQALLEDL